MSSDVQILIANIVFPIVISMYLLIRIERKLYVLCYSINELSKNINVIKTK
ncbi:YvrJ family protein [Paeniclostridium sp. NSJ-45]|uniref:YvrJ family protein n=1 Tax=Paeniclostridium hominis TaxID=2764329 RepID=A0ABR7K3G5_9FIRM|nr:YvrJ family protein [Paeniclostridium hominis]